ncbi:MAG: bi-domain-containing oxidoreductase [Deltaproteobacteria bacterium]|nr:bi-domain-containing oxidoreductase [Deltaproteobacteria bacterium]
MKQVLVKGGRVVVEEVPAPVLEPGRVLVRVANSAISVGTEMAGVRASGKPLFRRVLEKPEQLKRAIDMAAAKGIGPTWEFVAGKLGQTSPTGYSAAGTVIGAGDGVDDLRPGDRVACAGAGLANHAEFVSVPRNLAAPLPEGLDFERGCTVTLGAIALQGVRRAMPTLGETFVVIGLGILGQLAVQLLRANGCRVIGADIDRARIDLATRLGMDAAICPDEGADIDRVARLTDGIGADGVIVTASAPSDEILAHAFRMCRRKGRVVLVGDVGLHLRREDIYVKELDFLISTSYGPGRYDAAYEEEGLDYPVGYVRWTENRNMVEYLRLAAAGKVDLGPLVSRVWPVERADEAYEALAGRDKPLLALLSYGGGAAEPERAIPNPKARPARAGQIGVAVVGAGAFAREMHLPNIKALRDRFWLKAVSDVAGHAAAAAAAQYGAGYATTDFDRVLADREVDAVVITTRHRTHAAMSLAALRAGKHVFVEKPLALSAAELATITDFYAAAPAGETRPVLLTGFNRRFSKYARRIRDLNANRTNPMILNYRMNAGYVPLAHWVQTSEGGGRNLGEACHIYDLFTFLTGARTVGVSASAIEPGTGCYGRTDNFVAVVSLDDGSVGTLTYTALGSKDHPKERLEVYCDGLVISLDDYRGLSVAGARRGGIKAEPQDKGHRDELIAFADGIARGEWPIPLWQQVQATEIALEVERLIAGVAGETAENG